MNPALTLAAVSFKRQIWIVMVSLAVIMTLPLVALASTSSWSDQRTSALSLYTGPISTTDTYFYGQCTYWAALRREQTGHPIPNNWGNANTWAVNARLAGYMVDHTPAVGAVMETTVGPYGHVAFVESVDPTDGSWTISEMNFKGWDVTDNRTFPPSAAMQYSFIH
jgi:surface antigen